MLAQTASYREATHQAGDEAQRQGMDIFQRLREWEWPTQGEYVDSLMSMDMALALVLLVCGLVYMLQGWKVFKMLVIVNAAILGGFLGSELGKHLQFEHGPIFGAVAGALLFSVLAWPLMKGAVSLMGGLAGSFVGYGMWSYAAKVAGRPGMADYTWVGALMGFIALGLLGFIIFKTIIILFTSLQGSLMTISGLVAVACRVGAIRETLYPPLRSNAHMLLLLIALPAIIALVFQYSGFTKQAKKKPASG